ncbi:MAG: hypothetical protein ABEH35_00970 [Haloarculaceae archaeon]
MVGPSISDEDRASFLLKLRVGFAAMVGFSMAAVSAYSDAGLPVVAVAAVGGTAVGALLAWWTIPDGLAETPYRRS